MHALMTEREHFCCVVCVGVVWLNSGRHQPGVFSIARTLLFRTLSLKTFGKHNIDVKGCASHIGICISISVNMYICVCVYMYACVNDG